MWFLKNLDRVATERQAIASLFQDADWLTRADWGFCGAKLCLIADIEAHGRCYLVRMVYPDCYPASPPAVTPREGNQRWSTHQYGQGGELCLEWGPDTWQQCVTGADVLRSAYKLLDTENPLGRGTPRVPALSRHALTPGQELKSTRCRFVRDRALVAYAQSLPQDITGIARIVMFLSRPDVTAFAVSFEPTGGQEWLNPTLPKELKNEGVRFEVPFVKSTQEATALDSLNTEAVIKAHKAHGADVSSFKDSPPRFVLVVDRSGGVHLFWAQDWSPFRELDIDEKEGEKRLPPEYGRLNSKKVGIVGLGSAGSKIAVSLARSGVRRFLLIDHDVFLPANLCRHELNWEDIGQHKVEAVANRIGLITPSAEIKCRRLLLSGQEATASVDSALGQLGECDLIVDATADSSTFNQLSSVVSQYRKPMVWLEVFGGGIGGLLARYRPGKDPEPQLVRAFLNDYLAQQEKPDLRTTADYTAIDAHGEPIIASNADVDVFAAHVTRMVLDILLEREPSIFPVSLYLIGLSRYWIFEQPFHTIPIDLSKVEVPTRKSEPSKEEAEDNIRFLTQLIDKKNENRATH